MLTTLIVVLLIIFNFILMIIVIGFMFMTLRNIKMCLHYLLDDPLHRRVRSQIRFRRCKLLTCHTFINLFYLFMFLETSTLSLSYFMAPANPSADRSLISKELSLESRYLLRIQCVIEAITVCALALIQSGLLDQCMNCGHGPHATNNEVLEMNLLSMEYLDQVLIELNQFSNEWNNRLKKVTWYELTLTDEAMGFENEPIDKADFHEFEKDE